MIIFQLPKRREAEKEGHFNYTFPSNKETHLQTTHILTYIIEYINVIICIQCKPMIISSRQDNYFPFLHSDMNPAVSYDTWHQNNLNKVEIPIRPEQRGTSQITHLHTEVLPLPARQ